MGISCNCDLGDYDYYYYPPKDFSILNTKRGRRCISCNNLVHVGSECLEFDRYRMPRSYYEERRFGDEISLPPKFMCERCGEIYLSLSAYGYCISIGENIIYDLQDHWDNTGFKPNMEWKNKIDNSGPDHCDGEWAEGFDERCGKC